MTEAAGPARATPVQFGRHGAPTHVIAHLSDTHVLAGGADLYGTVPTDGSIRTALDRLESSGMRPDAIVFTGDVADRGEDDAYLRLRNLVEPVAERIGAALIWVMGNHDERVPFRRILLGEAGASASTPASRAPVDRVVEVRGLRIVALDTSVPGYHHGDLDPAQLAWLADVLAEPAERGTVIAMHHPPIPTSLAAMQILELEHQDEFAAVIAGTDVRAVLGGHLHYPTTSTLAGIPVSVAAATCYTMDVTAPTGELRGVAAGQAMNIVHVYADRVVHSVASLAAGPTVTRFGAEFIAAMAERSPEERRDAFSRQRTADE